jgi:hypothetical protein
VLGAIPAVVAPVIATIVTAIIASVVPTVIATVIPSISAVVGLGGGHRRRGGDRAGDTGHGEY